MNSVRGDSKMLFKSQQSSGNMNFTPVEKEAIYRYLSKKVSFFSMYKPEILQKIALEIIPMTFAPGSIIFKQD